MPDTLTAPQFAYPVRSDVTPFSVTPGGFANFTAEPEINVDDAVSVEETHIVWSLRENGGNEVFRATQQIVRDHEAVYAVVVSDQPLNPGGTYETVEIDMPAAQHEALKGPFAAQTTASQRIGIARGTHVMTSRGEVAVENLSVGDRVITRDHGMQAIRHIGRETRTVSDDTAPILFRAGSIKNNRDLIVSADHRVVVKGAEAIRNYGVKEVLVPARNLVDGENIVQGVGGSMEFFQILTDQHEVIYSEAAATESFMPDENGLTALSPANRKAMIAAMPVLAQAPETYGPSARRFVDSTFG